MNQIRSLLACFLCICLLSMTALTGCGSTTEETSAENTSAENTIVAEGELADQLQLTDVTLTGTVESIDGQTVTLTIGGGMDVGGMGAEMPGGDGQGEMPSDVPNGDGQGEMPSDVPSGDGQGEMPNDVPGGDGQGEMPSDVPSGDGQGEMPSGMDGDGVSGTVVLTLADESVLTTSDGASAGLADLEVGDQLTITIDENGAITSIVIGAAGAMTMGSPNLSSGVTDYTSATELTQDAAISGETFDSTGTDENAIYIHGATVTLSDVTVIRTSSNSTGGDNSSFYGVGAAILVADGSATISDSEITTDAAGGAGVFSYGDGVAYVMNTTIRTSQNTSGGIHVAGGGTLYAWDLDVETQGESAAAIRSDRGGGTMVVDGGSYVSNGIGSPAVYCTADIAVNNATLTANASEGVCIEGKNAIYLYDCDLTSNMLDNSQNDCTWSLIVYQSMSGDAEVGNGTLQLIGGSLVSSNGGLLYTTNTSSSILLSGVDIQAAEDCEFFLKCTGNANQRGWGSTGSNGAQCVFTAIDQIMNGDIVYDSISTLDCYLQNGSVFTGAIVDDESCAGNGGSGYCNVSIGRDAQWIVTGDSTLTSLACAGTIQDDAGQSVTIQGVDGTVYVQGSGSYTITVDSYSTSADFSGAATATSFSDFSVSQNAD
jgi:hypothetical protein